MMERGASLYFSLLVVGVLLGIGFGIHSVFLIRLEELRGLGKSVIALYAADAGVEHVLYIDIQNCSRQRRRDRVDCLKTQVSGLSESQRTLQNGARYELTVLAPGEKTCVVGSTYCVRSFGIYFEVTREVRRALEVTR